MWIAARMRVTTWTRRSSTVPRRGSTPTPSTRCCSVGKITTTNTSWKSLTSRLSSVSYTVLLYTVASFDVKCDCVSQVSQASHDSDGFTQITFSWREGQITKIDKFHNGSYWSLATLMCTVLLGVERCVAFVNRAKNNRVKTSPAIKTSVESTNCSPSPPPGVNDPNYLTKDPKSDGSRFAWSGNSLKK